MEKSRERTDRTEVKAKLQHVKGNNKRERIDENGSENSWL